MTHLKQWKSVSLALWFWLAVLCRPSVVVSHSSSSVLVASIDSDAADNWENKTRWPEAGVGRQRVDVDRKPASASCQRFDRIPRELQPANYNSSSNEATNSTSSKIVAGKRRLRQIRVSAIHVDRAEFPLSKLLFRLTLELALNDANKYLEKQQQRASNDSRDGGQTEKVELVLSVRSANTCSRQFAGALAAEEFYLKRARLFIVSGCDDAIRGVSRLAGQWRVPIMTAAGFGADLSDKSLYQTLVRVAFSLRATIEFLFKILRMFHWRHVNLVVDESDANSLALKESVEKHLASYETAPELNQTVLNTIVLDLEALLSLRLDNATTTTTTASTSKWLQSDDKWPNEIIEKAISDTLWRCARFSRVTIVLMSQRHLRKFMLSAYDQGMANGQYTFINMPLLSRSDRSYADHDQDDQDDDGAKLGAPNRNATGRNYSLLNSASVAAATGENEFLWRSARSRSRNAHARQAFESLMSIYLRTPTTKAYVYFANNLNELANGGAETRRPASLNASSAQQQVERADGKRRIKLKTNPYSASFYDSVMIYARVLRESLLLMNASAIGPHHRQLKQVHARISELIRARRFENMVTGSVVINRNGDRETDFTLDDMNQMTGLFAPVILYSGHTREIQRIGRIHWSSDSSVGPTSDTVDCHLLGSCSSARLMLARSALWLALLAGPLATLLGLFYLVHSRLKLESQLLDHWWRIHLNEIEILKTRRKNAKSGQLVVSGEQLGAGSVVSSSAPTSFQQHEHRQRRHNKKSVTLSGTNGTNNGPAPINADKTDVTRATTDASAGWASSSADVCYGNITLGIFKLAKVALKPISRFHQSRKLMIELRGLKEMNHANLCRFVGIVVDEGSLAIVSEFCPKGSLREFFRDESMIIDWAFKYSIINDVMAGLMYLHSSPLGFHGRLKSSNCLVSGRFVIKLSDYGPHTLLEQQEHQPGSRSNDYEDWLTKRVWLAPEHMAGSSLRSSGSKLGDVYSFGLLLYEIITNCAPFTSADTGELALPVEKLFEGLRTTGPGGQIGPDMSLVDRIIAEGGGGGGGTGGPLSSENKVTQRGAPQEQAATSATFQVPATIGPLVELMQACWRFNASKRPTLNELNSNLKRITRGVTSAKLLENLTKRMEQYTNNLESLVEAKLATLVDEKFKTEELLYQFVPKSIASLLREGQFVEPEAFECVTVFYSDIVGFTSLSSESSPMEVVDFLSELYLCFDETLEQYDIFKVDTIGDAYIVASGLPQLNDGKHVIEIAHTALELRDRLKRFKIPHMPGRSLEMRVGIHSGPCVAGIVGGLNMPKYCVFGDTLTIGKFMESSGLPMRIHITDESRRLLAGNAEFHIEPRQPKITRDGLPYQTYWLERGLV